MSSSSVNKGESLRDTIETIAAMGVDAFVVRHKSSGAPQLITHWTNASIVNAGDGWHQHPTQALLDCYTIRTSLNRRDSFDGLRIAIVGDIKHSRVARSNVDAFSALGAHVTLVAPPTLLPPTLDGWPVDVSYDFDATLPDLDVLYLLRVQRERMDDALLPSLREYSSMYGLTAQRAACLAPWGTGFGRWSYCHFRRWRDRRRSGPRNARGHRRTPRPTGRRDWPGSLPGEARQDGASCVPEATAQERS